MNENLKKAIDALRSGEFQQGTGRLRTDLGYCCLGVFCEVYRRETGKGRWDSENRSVFIATERDISMGELPERVRKWLGCSSNSPVFGGVGLVTLNDGGVSFSEIANIIEVADGVADAP